MSAQPLERREGARGLKAAGAAAASSSARGAPGSSRRSAAAAVPRELPVLFRAEPSGQDSRRCGGKGNLATAVTGW